MAFYISPIIRFNSSCITRNLYNGFNRLTLIKNTSRDYVMSFCSSKTDYVFKPDELNISNDVAPVFDLVIVGGGIIGITIARATLIENPNLKVAVLEKEADIAVHQSSHNSGVIHGGIYYKPQTIKAKFCVAGLKATYKFCDEHNVPYRKCGKLIVATNETELYGLKRLYNNAIQNHAPDVEFIDEKKIKEIEAHCRGICAIYSPHTGIIDWGLFTKYCAVDYQKRGGLVFCNFEVDKIEEIREGTENDDVSSCPIEFFSTKQKQVVRAKYGIACGGLHSDRLAKIASGLNEPVVIPFRGEYLELKEEKRHLVRGNIYPVPDNRFPFLGVHFTPRLDGRVLLGPNAVLALSREGYRWSDINKHDLFEMIKFAGFWKLANRYFDYGYEEIIKSLFISKQVKVLQKYIPEITTNDVVFKGFTGVRAQAVDSEGILVDDLIMQLGTEGIEKRILHIRNAPSPAATSSLALSEFIVKSMLVDFDF